MSINSDILEVIDTNPGIDSEGVVSNLHHLSEGSVRAGLSYIRSKKLVDFESSRSGNNRPTFKHYKKGTLKRELEPTLVQIGLVKPIEPQVVKQVETSEVDKIELPLVGQSEKHPFDVLIENFTDGIMEVMIPSLRQYIEEKLVKKLSEELGGSYSKVGKDLLNSEAFRRVRKPRALIVGLLPSQEHIISKEFGNEFDLDFWKDGDITRLRDLSRNCENIFSMTKFVSPDTEHVIEKVNKNLVRATGMSSLKDELTKVYVG